jgi:orotate phosphoribosyltransferase
MIPRWSQIISQNQSGKESRYHFDQTLAYLKMSPVHDTFSIDTKNKTLDYIFNTIVKAIPLTVNQNFK